MSEQTINEQTVNEPAVHQQTVNEPAVHQQTPDPQRDDLDDHDAYEQARTLLRDGRPVEAAQIAAPLEQREQLPEAFLELLAQAFFASAQLGNAERVLRRLVEQAPANGWAHRALARTLERRGNGAEAARFHRLADGFGVD